MNRINRFYCFLFLMLVLSGCMSSRPISSTESKLTMQEIYEAHFVNFEYDESKYVFLHGSEDSSVSAQEIRNQVHQTFPTLKNQFLVMYVFPRLNSEDGTPIPGFWTAFPLYDKIEFALPGEEANVGDND